MTALVLVGLASHTPRAARADGLPASGQKKCWTAAGAAQPCGGSGQDGDKRGGRPLALVDNGDGTITDLNTRLVWEKLARDGGVHDQGAVATWAQAFTKIAQLDTPPCFAGSCAWRLPNAKELSSIVDFQRTAPAVAKAFVKKCKAGCDGVACGCSPAQPINGSSGSWTSTSAVAAPADAWQLDHVTGGLAAVSKSSLGTVRAVRSLDPCTKATARIALTYEAQGGASGVVADLDYPSSLVSLPGFGNDPTVLARVTNLTGISSGLFSAGDTDSSISVGLVSIAQAIPPGAFADVTFDCQPGAPAPTVDDLSCTSTVSDAQGGDVASTCIVSAMATR